MPKKPTLVWDRWNLRHIRKHRVSQQEVEEAYRASKLSKPTYGQRKLVYGLTKSGRYLTIALSFAKQKRPYVVSARNMNNKERKEYYEQTS